MYLAVVSGFSRMYLAVVSGFSRMYLSVVSGFSRMYLSVVSGFSRMYLSVVSGFSRTYSHASVIQIDSSVRPIGGAGRPCAVINLRSSAPASACAMADCTPTRTRPSA
jgi:hypothetical protein